MPQTILALWNMFEEIIQYLFEKGAIHERNVYDLRAFIAQLESQNEFTRSRLLEMVQKYNYENQVPEAETECFPSLELLRGMAEFTTTSILNWDGSCDESDIVVVDFETADVSDEQRIAKVAERGAVKIDLQRFPVSRLGLYEFSDYETAFYLAWLAAMWQDIDGNERCGMKVCTIQNNSVARFSLNDFLHDDFSAFMQADYGPEPPRIGPFFSRKLTIVELFQRACQRSYPFNPYKNYWRYFEREDRFKEIVFWNNATGVREGQLSEQMTAEVGQITQHPDSRTALLYMTTYTNQAIFEGWEEKLRPIGLPEKMHEDAFHFDRWLGISWPIETVHTEEDIRSFEKRTGITLPSVFATFIQVLRGKVDGYKHYYPINDLYTVRVISFYPLNELELMAELTPKEAKDWLPFAELEEGEMAAVGVQPGTPGFGKVAILRQSGQQIVPCDYTFEQFVQYAQESPVQPEIFAAQENDAEFLQKRISEGWDPGTSYRYQKAIEVAAEYNSHEALKVLLQAGERLRHPNHREITWLYDEETMRILDQSQP